MSKHLLPKAIDMSIGFIGAGNLCYHLTKGFVKAGAVRANQIIASSPETKKSTVTEIKKLGVKFTPNNMECVDKSKFVVLAIKPKLIPYVIDEISNNLNDSHTVISFAAGVHISAIERRLSEDIKVIRAMTNTCCAVKEGATVFAAGKNVTENDGNEFENLFSRVGLVEEVEEAQIDTVTGLSGSGPAYAFEAIEALADGAVKMGLPRNLAMKLGAQTLIGAGRMLLETGRHPGDLKDAICSPEGATIYALHHLEKGGFRSLLIDAVEASCLRTKQLQEQASQEQTEGEEIKQRIRDGLHLKHLLEDNGYLKK